MNIQEYKQRRQQVLELADELAQQVQGSPEATKVTVPGLQLTADDKTEVNDTVSVANELKAIHDKLSEDTFRIALIAGFQSGKSTTFNAFLDGQEISPRGKLIATSAVVIHGQHTSKPELQGKAEITWKSDQELIQMLPPPIIDQLKKVPELKTRLKDVSNVEELSNCFRLDNAKDRDYLLTACTKEWVRYTEDRSRYDKNDFALLRVALVMLAKYDRPTIRGARAQQKPLFPVEEVAKFVCFPDKWEQHFEQDKPTLPADEASFFIFVKKVTCYVNSPALQKIGCVVVDCPGLFSSAYDTKVAIEEIKDCDVAWFLMGDKQVADSEIKQIQTVAQIKPNGLVFSVNMKGITHEHAENAIIPADRARINQQVERPAKSAKDKSEPLVREGDIFAYHARLALVSEQAQRISEGTLSTHSKEAILDNVKVMVEETDDVHEALEMEAEDDLKASGIPRSEVRKFALFDDDGTVIPEGLELVRKQSRLDTIIAAIENIVARNKPRIVLQDNGTVRIRRVFKAVAQSVTSSASSLKQTQESAEKAVKAQAERLNAFSAEIDEVLHSDKLDVEELADALRRDFVSSVINPAKNSIESHIRLQADALMNKEGSALQNAVSDIVNNNINVSIAAWQEVIKGGNCEAIKDFQKRVMELVATINRKWHTQAKVGEVGATNVQGVSLSTGTDIDMGFDWLSAISLGSNILWFIPVGGWVVRGLVAAGIGLFSWLIGNDIRQEKFANGMCENVSKALNTFVANELPEKMMTMATQIRDQMVKQIKNSIQERIKAEQAELERLRKIRDAGDTKRELARLEDFAKRLSAYDTQLTAFEKKLDIELKP